MPIDAGDRDLAPPIPASPIRRRSTTWDPPFPLDLRRIRPVDEAYWEQYRTTPKAFIPLEAGQRLWRSRYGALTSIRVVRPDGRLARRRARATSRSACARAIDPLAFGLAVRDVRAESLAASRGATDFGEYFVYFSFFLVVSALLLAALFFKLGVEQRAREVGLLRAVGFGPAQVRRLFLGEGAAARRSSAASLGVLGALGYAWLIMFGLRTWWVDAVGTTALDAARVAVVARRRRARRRRRRARLHLVDAARARSHLRAQPAGGQIDPDGSVAAPRSGQAGRKRTRCWSRRVVLARRRGRAPRGGRRRVDCARTGAFFGAGSALLGASLCLFSLYAPPAGPHRARRARLAAGLAARPAQRHAIVPGAACCRWR